MFIRLLCRAFILSAALLSANSGHALIIYGTGPTDLSNTRNITAPASGVASGAPWPYIVQFGTNNASGIYLGNGYILTANHVNPIPASFVINGISYNRDTAYGPVPVTEDVLPTNYPTNPDFADVVDMKLVRVLNPPVMAALPINTYAGTGTGAGTDIGGTSVLIGCGVGKGSVVTGGWSWGDGTTYAKRWGTNSVAGYQAAYSGIPYEILYTFFNASVGDESQITLGDSGSGLFKQFSGTWKLTGVATSVSTAGSALYSPTDYSIFIRISKYAHLLRYENWASTKLGSPTASMTADTDKDGLPQLLEYAFHTDPGIASTSALPQVGMESGYLTLTYTQLLTATDLTYKVQESPTLANGSWTDAAVIEETVSTSGVTRVVKAKVALNSATQKFLRLSVTQIP
ncbi:MAG: hypothetical protein K8R23_02495 [Chthoniobacter sp.]|nr:hypothetical protein [Chthoniobacter sp.]